MPTAEKSPSKAIGQLDTKAVDQIGAELRPLLADCFALYLKTKNFHWHMTGKHFRDYHLLLDEQADQIFAMTDPVAERARKLGATTLHSISEVGASQRLKDENGHHLSPKAMLSELYADNRQLTAFLRSTHEVCDRNNDVATASLIEVWIDETERRAWFLGETIEGSTKSVLLAFILCSAATLAQTAGQGSDPSLGITTLQLWPSGDPAIAGTPEGDQPTLTVFVPQTGKGTGSAVIVAPGGAYLHLASNLEGRQVADWFTSQGVTAFVLKYRLGAKYLYPIPLRDAQRAVRLVRSSAAAYGFSPDRIGFVGFSAGGHLAATTGTLFDSGKPDASDPVERVSSRPDFLVLGYPWLNAMQPSGHFITYCSVIKIPEDICKLDEALYTPSRHVTAQTPSTFIYSTSDDSTVPISASVDFYSALITAGVPAEMHIFRHGGHGSGMGEGDAALDQWPGLLAQWMRNQGLLTPVTKP